MAAYLYDRKPYNTGEARNTVYIDTGIWALSHIR